MDIFTIPGREYDSNVYVVVGKVPTVIDTGTGFYAGVILETIQKIVKLNQIQQILLTHEHYDHVGGVQDIVQASKGRAKIFAHKDVVPKLKEGKSTFVEMLGGVMPKLKVDIPLAGGEQLTIGDQPFEVLVTPGHSIGSLCFYSKKRQVLFSGDTIFADGGFGRYDFPGGDFNTLLNSIERLTALEVKSLYPGHGCIVEQHGKDHVLKALSSIRSLMQMPHVRDILNEIKWTKDLEKIKIWYVHRGALNNTKIISGIEITGIGRSFLETTTATIPYHRIIKILYDEKTVFDRWKFGFKDKQL